MKGKIAGIVFILFLISTAIGLGLYLDNKIKQQPKTKVQTFLVTKVIDGDTIEVNNNLKVRYIGVDTPEVLDPRKTVQCFGKEASVRNKELVEGKTITMEKDISETDKYGRLLRYVFIDGKMINKQLVDEGYAKVDTFPPDVKYSQVFIESEKQARINNLGLWRICKLNEQK